MYRKAITERSGSIVLYYVVLQHIRNSEKRSKKEICDFSFEVPIMLKVKGRNAINSVKTFRKCTSTARNNRKEYTVVVL